MTDEETVNVADPDEDAEEAEETVEDGVIEDEPEEAPEG